jgi:prevent-host-death family protein
MSVLPIAEARRRLPELVRKVAEGHPPFVLGRRGRPEAVLTGPALAERTTPLRPLVGLIEILGSWEEVEKAEERLRAAVAESLDRTARELEAPAGRARRRARRE